MHSLALRYMFTAHSLRRHGDEKEQLLLSCIEPHKELVKSTIAGWVKQVLASSGV